MNSVEDVSVAIAPWVGASGTCDSDAETLLEAINDIRRLFYPKTDYTTTVEWVDICCVNKCFYLPARYEVVRSVMICGQPVTLQNEWYQLTHPGDSPCIDFAEDRGNPNCKFREYHECEYKLQVYSDSNLDEGTKLQFKARTKFGRWINVELTLADAFTAVESTEHIVTYVSITKPTTKGMIRVYAHDTNHDKTLLLAIHQAFEVNPMYKKYTVPACCTNVRVNAKLKYFKLEGPLDLVEFPIDAMIHGAMALTHRRNRETEDYQKELALAFGEIESDMAGKETQGSTPLRMHLGSREDNPIQYGFGRSGVRRR